MISYSALCADSEIGLIISSAMLLNPVLISDSSSLIKSNSIKLILQQELIDSYLITSSTK